MQATGAAGVVRVVLDEAVLDVVGGAEEVEAGDGDEDSRSEVERIMRMIKTTATSMRVKLRSKQAASGGILSTGYGSPSVAASFN